MQPPLTMYNHWQSSFTINPTSINFDATCIDYVQPLAEQFHNIFDQSQLRNNLDELLTSTCTALLQSRWSLSSLKQPRFSTYKQWHNTFTIDSISLKSEATLIDYVQPLAKQFHNRFHQSQVWSNLHWLRTTSSKAVSQSTPSVSSLKQPQFTAYPDTSTGKAVSQSIQSLSPPKQPWFTTYLDTSTGKAVSHSIWSVSAPKASGLPTYLAHHTSV